MPSPVRSCMCTLPLAFMVGLSITASAQRTQSQPNPRLRLRWDAGWKFRRDPLPTATNAAGLKWQWKYADVDRLELDALPADVGGGAWQPATIGRGVFRRGRRFAWFRTDLGGDPGRRNRLLHFESVDDNAAVYLNGKQVVVHRGWNDPFDVRTAPAWHDGGPNELVILVENTGGDGGIMGPVSFEVDAPEQEPAEIQPDFDDRSWRTVHLPHDYIVEGTFTPTADASHGSLPTVPAWYRKTFHIPAEWRGKSLWFDFDGVYRNSTVWLNGIKLGTQPSGYIGFRYDISSSANYGDRNVLVVRVDPRRAEGWWYEGGGIYRHVWLNVADPLHVAPWGVFVQSSVEGRNARIRLETTLANASQRPANCELSSRIVAPDGKAVAEIKSGLQMRGSRSMQATQMVIIPSPTLWSIESPNLYRLESTVLRDGRVVDRTSTSFGIRTIRFDADKGFFLNGKPVKMNGTCNHQDHAGVGIAIPDRLFGWRIRKLKAMGSNAYRCSHNPPAPELLDACDRLGMIVMDETRHLGDTQLSKSPPGTKADDLSELKSMLLRDRNHPSIVMWSMFNEENLQGTPEGGRIFAAMKAVTRRLDPTRPVTEAMNYGWGGDVSRETDLQGFNYSIGEYDRFHARFPQTPVFGSETASTVSTRGIYANDRQRGYVSAYDVNHPEWAETAEHAWKPIAEREWMFGAFVWTGFDYKGEPTPYGWPCINSHFGILDICGFPKDNFWYYRAWWGDQPVVHILPHWNWKGQEGKPISVWCQSNCDRVELLLNGKSLGIKSVPKYGHVEWDVPYRPGVLQARGYRGDVKVAGDHVETTGPPAAISLVCDHRALNADGEDVGLVEVTILDSMGRTVPTASNMVQFAVRGAGDIRGVGNGDPSSHEPDKASRRSAFNGLCMALVGAKEAAGDIILTAKSPGLKSATIRLSSYGKPAMDPTRLLPREMPTLPPAARERGVERERERRKRRD